MRRRALLRGGLAVWIMGAAGPSAAAPGRKLRFSGREWGVHATPNSHALLAASFQGAPYHRFEVRGQDTAFLDRGKAPRNRAELYSLSRDPNGKETWFSYSFRIRNGPPTTATFCILGQFHSTPDIGDAPGLSPVFAINLVREGTLRFVSRTSATPLQTFNPKPTVLRDVQGIARERWYRLVGRIVFDYAGRGSVEVWMNGNKIIDRKNIPIGYNDKKGPYWKFGIYRAAAAEPLVVDYANMEIGSKSLMPRVGKPLPVPL